MLVVMPKGKWPCWMFEQCCREYWTILCQYEIPPNHDYQIPMLAAFNFDIFVSNLAETKFGKASDAWNSHNRPEFQRYTNIQEPLSKPHWSLPPQQWREHTLTCKTNNIHYIISAYANIDKGFRTVSRIVLRCSTATLTMAAHKSNARANW